MRYQSSKKGRRRRTIKQGNAKIKFTAKGVTPYGGMGLVSRAMESLGLRDRLHQLSSDLDSGCKQASAKLLEQLIVLGFLGGEALSDTNILRDEGLAHMFGWDTVLHPTSIARRLKNFTYRHNVGLQSICRDLGQAVLNEDEDLLVAVDSTVIQSCGSQQGSEIGYNPNRPGRPSYHALLAVAVKPRAIVDGYLRPGSCGANNGLDGFLSKIVEESQAPASRFIFRIDRGMTADHTLDTVEKLGASYVAKVKKTSPLMARVSRVNNWRPIGGGAFAASFHFQPQAWSKTRRFVVIERNVEPKDSNQLSLFDCDLYDGRYEIIVTNLSLKAENVWRLYNQGAVVEQIIEEIKNDFCAGGIKTNSFWANDALYIIAQIGYNLLNYIRRIALPKPYRTARIKRLKLMFFFLGARLARHARNFWVFIDRDYPLRMIFYRAMDILAARS